MNGNDPKPAPAIRLTSGDEPLPGETIQCLQTLAAMALADANALLGTGAWSGLVLGFEFDPDGGVGTVFQIDAVDEEKRFHNLTREDASRMLLQLREQVAEMDEPWQVVNLRVQPDGVAELEHVELEGGQPAEAQQWAGPGEYENLLEATTAARLSYFRTLGVPDADLLFPLVDPALRGAPAWPTRPAWQCIRRGAHTLLASSGLADPFRHADGPNVGFGVEIAVATSDQIGAVPPAWLLESIQAVCFQAADDGRFDLRHERFGVFLIGANWVSDTLPGWLDDNGDLGFLVGLSVQGLESSIPLPAGTATLLMAKLLTPREYAYVADRGEEGAQELVERFQRDGTAHLSSLRRSSAI